MLETDYQIPPCPIKHRPIFWSPSKAIVGGKFLSETMERKCTKYSSLFFSSPELKAQVSLLIVCRPSSVRPSVCPSVCKLLIFSSSSLEPLGQFQPNSAQNILGWWELKNLSNEGSHNFTRGDNYENSENTLTKFKNLLLQNHWANFI